MGYAQPRKEGEGSPVNEPEYQYGGQWFDDWGALALSFTDSPQMGIDIARSGVSRAQANDMAKNIIRSGLTPYDEAAPVPLGSEYEDAQLEQPEGPTGSF